MLKGILSISGHGGLFKRVAEAKNNIIVESISTKKRMPAYTTSRISALEDVAIYTETGEVVLQDVFKKIHAFEKGGPSIDPKANETELKEYFGKILPDYDRNRVYVSDIRKIISWYNLLLEHDMIHFEEEEPAPEKEDNEGSTPEEES
jgi:hypothetical protein